MPKQLPSGVEARVLQLSEIGWPRKKILEHLKKHNMTIGRTTFRRIVNFIGQKRQSIKNNQPLKPKTHTRWVLTNDILKKLKKKISTPNPPTQNQLARQLGISQQQVCRGIKLLGAKMKKKCSVHKLSIEHKQNRKTNSRKLYENHLAGDKSEFTVTLDEALIYLNYCDGKRKICYVFEGEKISESWIHEHCENFTKGFMVVGAICGRGVLPLIKVPAKSKINAQNYIDFVLKPLLEVEIPKLYPAEVNKVFVHHDKATSHTTSLTTKYAEDLKRRLGITIISKNDIPVKSPDTSPMDFFAFGYLKQKLFSRRARTLDGVWKVCQKEWNQIPSEIISKVFASWKRRLLTVSKKNGEHIEQTKQIHKRKIKV